MSVREFLKQRGVTAQREIELAVREQVDAGDLCGDVALEATPTVTVRGALARRGHPRDNLSPEERSGEPAHWSIIGRRPPLPIAVDPRGCVQESVAS
jgi:hypothetical protein